MSSKRSKCINICEISKIDYYRMKVDKCAGNSKKLFKLINTLTDGDKENPLPPSESLKHLANSFADFFIEKVQKIRQSIEEVLSIEAIEEYNHSYTNRSNEQFDEFRELTQDEVKKFIIKSKSKQCDPFQLLCLSNVWIVYCL